MRDVTRVSNISSEGKHSNDAPPICEFDHEPVTQPIPGELMAQLVASGPVVRS